MNTILGILLVTLAGIGTGTMVWPMKVVRRYQFEQIYFVAMLSGLVIIPWLVVLTTVPNLFAAYAMVDPKVLIKSNLFAMSWGIANVLFGLCIIRIGAALTGALLSATGVIVGVTMPMLIKASGLFSDAPNVASPAGITVISGVVVMILGVIMVTVAGFGRERSNQQSDDQKVNDKKAGGGGFLLGMILSILAGVLSSGISFAFIYSQAPIVNAMKAQGAGEVSANIAVWAMGLIGGALVNVLYAAYLMTKNKNWSELWNWPGDAFLASFFGIQFIIAMVLLGKGMVWLGVLGASVGFGIQQAMQILGTQAVGFISGEWRGVHKKPLTWMLLGICILLLAVILMGYGNTLAKA